MSPVQILHEQTRRIVCTTTEDQGRAILHSIWEAEARPVIHTVTLHHPVSPSLSHYFFPPFCFIKLTHLMDAAISLFSNYSPPTSLSSAVLALPRGQLNFTSSWLENQEENPVWRSLTTQHCLLGMHFYVDRGHLVCLRLYLQPHEIFCNILFFFSFFLFRILSFSKYGSTFTIRRTIRVDRRMISRY